MKSKKRKRTLTTKNNAKRTKMSAPGFKSNYAKKRSFLAHNGGWGFDYPDKPWK